MTKYLFVDLDECLFHCRFLGSDEKHARAVLGDNEKLVKADDEFYGSNLRPGTHDLLKALRAVPNSSLYVLTSSVSSYANANNIVQELGFKYNDIFTREDLQQTSLDPDRFGSGPVYLIDNLPRVENRIKIEFLRDIATNNVHYIKVPEFWGAIGDQSFNADLIKEILANINALKINTTS